ncbi:MAG: hypothetical protein KF802_02855 [Bdellovibrionaceae bacterium]|nr:hypothetical protein [Pseudobdellovibrionaceae bacterium]
MNSKLSPPLLRNIPERDLANFLVNEHPQVIAVILALLEVEKRGQVLKRLPEELQAEAMMRFANLESVEKPLLEKVCSILENELYQNPHNLVDLGGVVKVAETLNGLDKMTEKSIISRIESRDVPLADEIKMLMFVYEDLIRIDVRGLKVIFNEVSRETLIVALKTTPEILKTKILSCFSNRDKQCIESDYNVLGVVRLCDVETAQQTILNTAKRLEAEGKIYYGRGGVEDLIVGGEPLLSPDLESLSELVLDEKIKEERSRLAEYEIVQNDLQDLMKYKNGVAKLIREHPHCLSSLTEAERKQYSVAQSDSARDIKFVPTIDSVEVKTKADKIEYLKALQKQLGFYEFAEDDIADLNSYRDLWVKLNSLIQTETPSEEKSLLREFEEFVRRSGHKKS